MSPEANGHKTYNLDWLISVDDHILEPPNLWVDRVASKDRDRAPHMEVDDTGMDVWVYDGKRMPSSGLSAVVGKSKEEFSPEPLNYSEMRPGCYDAKARLEDMDRSGVLASLCFPTLPRFCGQLFMEASDREFGFQCLQIYNDWLVEDWCGVAPGRYIPLMLIPMWDPALAVKEMERMAAKGVTAFAFSENPEPLGLPTIHDTNGYWEPVMAAANELELVASMHVGSSSTLPKICNDAPFMANLTWGASRTSGTMLSWLFSGLFQRYPNLKIALSEGECGWMPYFLERAEQVLDKQRYWVKRGQTFMGHAGNGADLDTLDIRQSFRDHVYGCIIEDHHAVKSLAELGEDNVMCETDYPHSDSTWPNCIERRPQHHEGPSGERAVQAAARKRRTAVPVYAGRAACPGERVIPVAGVLDGKSAIVTGAGSGVGRVSAARFAQEGARVVVADIDLDNAKETVREIESAGGSADPVGADVSDEQQVQDRDRGRGRPVRSARHPVQQRRHPDAATRHDIRGPLARRLQPPGRGQPRRGVPRVQVRGAALQGAR